MKALVFSNLIKFYERVVEKGYDEIVFTALKLVNENTKFGNFLMDRKGKLYTLQGDFTKSVIEFRKEYSVKKLSKFWYSGFVYRYVGDDLYAEYQLGLEVIPSDAVEDFVEIVELLLFSLYEIYDGPFILELGHTDVYEYLLRDIPEEIHDKILRILNSKNLAEVEFLSQVEKFEKIDFSKIKAVIENSMYDREKEKIANINVPEKVKSDLYKVISRISNKFQDLRIEIDLSLARTEEHYSGLVFTIYDVSLSKVVAAGGQYTVNGEKGVGGCIFEEVRRC
uniref:ATP phosphoribosyltransferase regulatory subunit n=1 Tax=Fervidobacterium pennivorans TaxID=93466 RepID=A0A7V4NDX1_FERPE